MAMGPGETLLELGSFFLSIMSFVKNLPTQRTSGGSIDWGSAMKSAQPIAAQTKTLLDSVSANVSKTLADEGVFVLCRRNLYTRDNDAAPELKGSAKNERLSVFIQDLMVRNEVYKLKLLQELVYTMYLLAGDKAHEKGIGFGADILDELTTPTTLEGVRRKFDEMSLAVNQAKKLSPADLLSQLGTKISTGLNHGFIGVGSVFAVPTDKLSQLHAEGNTWATTPTIAGDASSTPLEQSRARLKNALPWFR